MEGIWAGRVELVDDVTVAEGKTLEVCPGTIVSPLKGTAKIFVNGTLTFSGSKTAMIEFEENPWSGIHVMGTLNGGYVKLNSVQTCIEGKNESQIELVGAQLTMCDQAFILWNGARFDRLLALGGRTSAVNGGVLSMIDSLFDLRHNGVPPDCLYWSAGGALFDHVRVTGCHCPIHATQAPEGFKATNSVFDGASVPIMIAGTIGELAGNNVPEGQPDILDLGGDMTIEVGNNYWGGDAPSIITDAETQFRGIETYASDPFDGAGPR